MDLVSFISSAIDQALDGLSLDSADKQRISAHLTKRSFDIPDVKSKFNYSLSDERYLSHTGGEVISVVRQPENLDVPGTERKFVEPRFARVRKPKPVKINVRYNLPDAAKQLFAASYARELDMNIIDSQPHDHAVAAVSRRIEMDLMLQDLWQRGCDVLSIPTNYDFSVIDIGGDWRIAEERKHYGMHVCAPLLSARDEAREARKRMAKPHSRINCCQSKFQDCQRTAPFGISLHSCYDITQEDLCIGMLKRSMKVVVGTMLLPVELEDLPLKKCMSYTDPIFQMAVTYITGTNALKYVPPALRKGVSKYIDSSQPDQVRYKFVNGSSIPYTHDYKSLLTYLHDKRLTVLHAGRHYNFRYEITRRVGSLIYFSMTQLTDELLPHAQRYVREITPAPYDGYVLKADPNLINTRSTILEGFKTVYIPRLLFDYVAVYSMTKVGTPDFTIDSVLAYTKSAMTKTRVNEYTVDLVGGEASIETLIATSVVAYKWAHDRVKLMNARVPHSAYLKVRAGAVNGIVKLLESAVDSTALINLVKAGIADLMTSAISHGKFTSLGERIAAEAESVYTLITGALTMGVVMLEDCDYMITPILDVTENLSSTSGPVPTDTGNLNRFSSNDEFSVNLPEFPDYSQTVVTPSALRTRSNVKSTRETVRVVGRAVSESNLMHPEGKIDPLHQHHIHVIQDFIELHSATQKEAEDSAMTLLKRTLVSNNNKVDNMIDIQALQKGNPVVMRVYDDKITSIHTLDKGKVLRESLDFNDLFSQYKGKKFGTLKMRGNEPINWEPCWFTLDVDPFPNINTGVSYDIVMLPALQISNAHLLRSLESKSHEMITCAMPNCETILVDGVAGCGKTEEQSNEYIALIKSNHVPLVLTATNVAACQVIERVERKISVNELDTDQSTKPIDIKCSTIDSFLMHPKQWDTNVSHILLDEALQMHAGKIFAVIELVAPTIVKAYGDSKQIGFINFSRLKSPNVETSFPYSKVEHRYRTWRIPLGPRINMLKSSVLYSDSFETNRVNNDRIILLGRCRALLGIFSVEWIYSQLKLKPNDQLLVLVYRADVADDLRMKYCITRQFPVIIDESTFNVAISTIGESQGNDVDHAVLLRMTPRDEPLFQQPSQTIVALTRSKLSWSYLTVPSGFPSLVETLLENVGLTIRDI